MQGSPLQDRIRQRRTVHESAGQDRTCRAAHCRTEQDMQGSTLHERTRQWRTEQDMQGRTMCDKTEELMKCRDCRREQYTQIAGQNRNIEQDMQQDILGQNNSVPDRTGHAGQPITGQNRTCRAAHS